MSKNNSELSKKQKELISLRKKMKENPYKRSKKELLQLLEDNPTVDLIDVEILSALQVDGRASFNSLAEILGLSVATISHRVTKLNDLNILRGFSAIVACEGLGFTENLWLMIYLKPGADVTKIGNQMTTLRGVKCIYSIFSDFDLLVHLCCGTDQDIENAFDKIGKIEDVVKVTKMSVYKKIKEDFRVQI